MPKVYSVIILFLCTYLAIQGQWKGEKGRGKSEPIGVSTLKVDFLDNQRHIFKTSLL